MLLPFFVYQRRDNKKLTCLNSNRLVPIFAVLSHYKHMVTSSNSKHNTYLSTDRITKSSSQYIVDFYMYTITIYYIQGAKIHGLKLFDDFLNRGNPHNDQQQGLLCFGVGNVYSKHTLVCTSYIVQNYQSLIVCQNYT